VAPQLIQQELPDVPEPSRSWSPESVTEPAPAAGSMRPAQDMLAL